MRNPNGGQHYGKPGRFDWQNKVRLNNDIPNNKKPEWTKLAGIPQNVNEGSWWFLLTKELAAEILLWSNRLNRPAQAKRVQQLERALRNGTYREDTPDPAKIDWDWQLMSGQKRLMAVANTGITIWICITIGMDPVLRELIDTAQTRTYRDRWRFRTSSQLNAMENEILSLYYSAHIDTSSSYEKDAALIIRESLIESIDWFLGVAGDMKKSKYYSAPVGLAFVEYHRQHPRKAMDFAAYYFDKDAEKVVPQAGELRKWMFGSKRAMSPPKVYSIIVGFMVAHLNNKPVAKLSVNRKADKYEEPYPSVEWPDNSWRPTVKFNEPNDDSTTVAGMRAQGLKSVNLVMAMVRLASNTTKLSASVIEQHALSDLEGFNNASYLGTRLHKRLHRCAASACGVFCYEHPEKDSEGFKLMLMNQKFLARVQELLAEVGNIRTSEGARECLAALNAAADTYNTRKAA